MAQPAAVALELSGSKKDVTMKAPASVKAGPAKISLKNASQVPDGAQLVKVEGDHSPQEVLKMGDAWGEKGKPLPDWLKLAGGVGNADPGTTLTVNQKLEPGNYLAVALEGNAYAPIEDAKKAFSSENSEGPPPFDEKESFNTAILDGGNSQVADLDPSCASSPTARADRPTR